MKQIAKETGFLNSKLVFAGDLIEHHERLPWCDIVNDVSNKKKDLLKATDLKQFETSTENLIDVKDDDLITYDEAAELIGKHKQVIVNAASVHKTINKFVCKDGKSYVSKSEVLSKLVGTHV